MWRTRKTRVFLASEDNKLANVVSIENDPTNDELRKSAQKIHSMVLKSSKIDKTNLKTWAERLKHYQDVTTGKISADNAVAWRQNELQSRINKLESNIQWHRNRIHGLTIAVASTILVPIFGQLAAAGITIAVADSEEKLNHLVPALDRLQSESKQLNYQRSDTVRETKLAQEELNHMKSIFKWQFFLQMLVF
jgi:hypothetical protein